MASDSASTDIASGVSKLSIKTSAPKGKAPQKKAHVVADSWEDEDLSSASEAGDDDHGDDNQRHASDHDEDREGLRGSKSVGTSAPPPTPMSPTYGSKVPFPLTANTTPAFDLPLDTGSYTPRGPGPAEPKRPEKTDAVARRMIASALGVKVPKRTEEQKAYEQAMRDKEKRRREEQKGLEKKREEEAAKAKQAAWGE